jgi:CRISPR-associated cst1 family protein
LEQNNTFTLRLNDFLFNSGILGFYKVLEYAEKEDLVKIQANQLVVQKEALEDFATNYVDAMVYTYQKDTRWNRLVQKLSYLENLDLEKEESKEQLKNIVDEVKKAFESKSYQAAYEIVKQTKENSYNPYDTVAFLKQEKEIEKQREQLVQLLQFLKEHRQIYCMKDIMYNKINVFWESVSFLNRSNTQKDIMQEYKTYFVDPLVGYLEKQGKSDYRCIQCGNLVSKSQSYSMGWLNDVGVDIARKQSGFWEYHADTILCPICNLIYSCAPLGFCVIGSNGVFVNNNSSFEMLRQDNNMTDLIEDMEQTINVGKVMQKVISNYLNQSNQLALEKKEIKEIDNIQVIKKSKDKYELNTISRDKLEIFHKAQKDFQDLVNRMIIKDKQVINIYDVVLSNFLQNRNQYELINLIFRNSIKEKLYVQYVDHILNIQRYCMGGIYVKSLREKMTEIRNAGRALRREYYSSGKNANKVETYIYQLLNAIKKNSKEEFIELVYRMYSGKALPATEAFEDLMTNDAVFRLLANEYILGLKTEEKVEEDKNEGGIKYEE